MKLELKKLRVYLFKDDNNGKVIAIAGKKNPKGQMQDIKRMRLIKKNYFESLST